MAIVNHTGNIAADETWAVTDEHHITGNCTFQGGATGNPIVVTIEPGVDIYFDGNFIGPFGDDATDYGMIDFQGTEANKITSQADPTVFPYQGFGQYFGLFMGYHVKLDMDWVLIKHAQAFLTMWNCANDTTDGGADIKNCSAQYCEVVFQDFPGAGAVNRNVDNLIVVDGLFCKKIHGGLWRGAAFDMSGSNPIQNWAIFVAQATFTDNIWIAFNTDAASKVKFEFTNFMMSGNKARLFRPQNMNAGEWLKVTITGLFADTVLHNEVALWPGEDGQYGVIIRNVGLWRELMTVQDAVIVNTCGNAIDVGLCDSATESITVQNCDLIGNIIAGLNYNSANTTLIMDSLYFKNNWGFECIGSGADPQPGDPVAPYGNGHYQWWDINNAQAPTNVKTTPIFPLGVENVAEGAPSDNSITITFDAEEGSVAGKRLRGIPFIRYGTASGGPYNSTAGVVPWDKEERYKVFSKWTSEYGTLETLNHSVTLSNLKAGTTYYYKCCFIDPLGRIAEGVEGTFDTTGSAIVRRDVSPSFSIRRT